MWFIFNIKSAVDIWHMSEAVNKQENTHDQNTLPVSTDFSQVTFQRPSAGYPTTNVQKPTYVSS